jgi:small-conductance mechanosensitive channel
VVNSKSFPTYLTLFLLAACLPCFGQLEDLLKKAESSSAENGKSVPDLRDQLEKWKLEAEGELARLDRYDTPEKLPEGISTSSLSSRRRDLEQTLLAISRHLLILDDAEEPVAALKEATAEADAWKGFDTPPPHSTLMVDELIERREAIEGKQVSNRSSVEVFKATLAGLLKESKAAEEGVELAIKGLEQAKDDKAQLQWKLDALKVKQRALFVRASGLQHAIASLEELMRANEVSLGLLSRKIKEAGDDLVFSEENLARIKEASADRQSAWKKEGAEYRKRQRKAVDEKAVAAAALASLKATPEPDPTALEMAELNVETAAVQLEALQSISDSLDAILQLEAFTPDSYELRFVLLNNPNPAERKAAIASLASLHQRLEAWEVVASNQLASVSADIGKEQSRASLLPADDPKLVPLNKQRAILWEKQALLQRAMQAITNQSRTVSRWLAYYTDKEKAPWYARAVEALSYGWQASKGIWNIPVNRYEETLEVDGQKVVQTRFVSLGSIISAVILFFIAYLIAAMISRRIQRILVHRAVIGENQARTLRTWVMLLVAFLLALATLNWLSIPLTIFAFLAGALAIGVGFGTQTIIKNFISGIILLFERKVRVGDIIEVDGINGVVSEINTRSSIVRGFNGIENLIPNSLFLENRVVNWTLNSRLLRRELSLRVALDSPVQKVIEILNEAAARHGLVLKEPAPLATLSHFGDNSLDFILYFWIELNDKTNGLLVDSDLRIMIEKRLADFDIQVGITRPQPLDAAIKSQAVIGGEEKSPIP